MTGAGSSPAGLAPAGVDPPAVAPLPRDAKTPIALWWDAGTKDYLTDSQGRYLSLHPVDQKVALALTVQQGTVSAVADMGNRLRTIRYSSGPTLRRNVENFVGLCLADSLAAGDIALISIDLIPAVPGAIGVIVNYVNLRTKRREKAQA